MKNTKSIINVTINGMTVNQAINDIKERLIGVEKSAFNIALLCVYSLGDEIPAYTDSMGNEHGKAICDKPIKKQADLLKLIGRSKATLSRWIKAMRLLIEKGYFSDFANGSLPFSYDKIICIFEHETSFNGYVLSDLMSMTVDTLEAMTETKEESKEEESSAEESKEETKEESVEESKEESVETATLTYNGTEYTVNKAAFEKWLAENAIVK